MLQQIVKDHGSIIYNGDNYVEAWHKEAEKRGLPNLSNTVDALPALISKKNIDLMEKYNVLSPREMESRCEIYLERYVKDVAVESRLTLEIAKTTIFPAAVKYQYQLASTALALKQLGKTPCTTVLDEVNELVQDLQDSIQRSGKGARESCGRIHARSRHVCARSHRSCHGQSARSGGQTGMRGVRRILAAADLSGNAVYQVVETGIFRKTPPSA